jgi:uncharacterized membrane protein YkvA (DUF1232 family)
VERVVETVVGVFVALLVLYAASVAALLVYARRHPDVVSLRDALRMLPDVLRLVRRLASDTTLPRRLRVGLFLLLAYLASPIDLVPDFVPVIGYADDVVILALALRWVVRTAGSEALAANWPGSPEGLSLVSRLAGLTESA